jgi:hypothetical protein
VVGCKSSGYRLVQVKSKEQLFKPSTLLILYCVDYVTPKVRAFSWRGLFGQSTRRSGRWMSSCLTAHRWVVRRNRRVDPVPFYRQACVTSSIHVVPFKYLQNILAGENFISLLMKRIIPEPHTEARVKIRWRGLFVSYQPMAIYLQPVKTVG